MESSFSPVMLLPTEAGEEDGEVGDALFVAPLAVGEEVVDMVAGFEVDFVVATDGPGGEDIGEGEDFVEIGVGGWRRFSVRASSRGCRA